ncbi:MAG: HEPN domain-containing protein [Candidatus Binatia bacterium]
MAGRGTLARTWFEQAEADLRAAEDSAIAEHYEWSCFQCQQAGEKALKAFLYAQGMTSMISHSLRRLLRECERVEASFSALVEEGRLLDQYYIPTRYPNGLDEEVPPTRYYERSDAEQCLRSARSILARVKPFFAS